MQYYQLAVWQMQTMLACAKSPERRQYWARELATAQARLEAVTPQQQWRQAA